MSVSALSRIILRFIAVVLAWLAGNALAADAAPRSLTLSLRLTGLDSPTIAAERLPKALIHRNVRGERVHAFLEALDAEWVRAVASAPFGAVHRWREV